MPYLYGGCVAAVGPIKIRLSDTALFGASVASREPAVALATARVTILVCVVIFLHFLDICSCGSCVGL